MNITSYYSVTTMNITPEATIQNDTDPGYFAEECLVGERKLSEPLPPDFFSSFPAPSQGIQYPAWEVALKVTSYVITMLIGGIGNILVILIIIFSRRMRNKTNLYVANLALSDVMVSLLCMWVHLGNNITTDWPFTRAMCKVNTFFQALSVTASVLFLTVISLDRFVAIVYPLRSRRGRAWLVYTSVVAVWLVSALLAGPHLYYQDMAVIRWLDRTEVFCIDTWPRYYYETSEGLCLTDVPTQEIYTTTHVAVLYFLPIGVMTCAYVIIGRTLWKRKIPGEANSKMVASQMKSRKKVIRMLIVVVLLFVVCWTPHQVIILYDTHKPKDHAYAEYFSRYVKYVVTYIGYANSALNPIIYGGLNDNFRQGFREAFKCALCLNRIRRAADGKWLHTTHVVTVTGRLKDTCTAQHRDSPSAGHSHTSGHTYDTTVLGTPSSHSSGPSARTDGPRVNRVAPLCHNPGGRVATPDQAPGCDVPGMVSWVPEPSVSGSKRSPSSSVPGRAPRALGVHAVNSGDPPDRTVANSPPYAWTDVKNF